MKYLYECQERLETFSVTDSLMGIYNRNGYYSISVEMFKNAQKESQNILILIGDMNNLKAVNDTFGHIEGDEGIKAVANAMKTACAKNEKCFRIGGDEFVIIGVGDYSKNDIKSKCQTIEAYIDEHNLKSKKPYEISASLGYEYAPARCFDNIENALSVADEKMFANKQDIKRGTTFRGADMPAKQLINKKAFCRKDRTSF